MDEKDFLNYQPNFKRDEKEKTGWIEEREDIDKYPELEELEEELENIQVADKINHYTETKELLKSKKEDLVRSLEEIELEKNRYIESALKELGFESTFGPESFQELFSKKETSAGEYVLGVIEKEIESERGDIKWEAYIEYLELEEEMRVLDEYIEKLIYPIIGKDTGVVNEDEELEELEEAWMTKVFEQLKENLIKQRDYRESLLFEPNSINKKRELLHETEKDKVLRSQEKNQIESNILTVQQKNFMLLSSINNIDNILNSTIEEESLSDNIFKNAESRKDKEEILKNLLINLKQSIDSENLKKKELKDTRRNIYSENRQKRIIDEYSTINRIFRENNLPTVHQMKTYTDRTNKQINKILNSTAKSIDSNFKENNEKTYETYLLQISTGQTREVRLKYVKDKQEARLLYQKLYNEYKDKLKEGDENA